MLPSNPFQGAPELSRRRSQRVILTLPVIVRPEGPSKDAGFEEETHTLIVNSHGALIVLAAKVTAGQKLRLINSRTKAEQICRVARVGAKSEGKCQVGIEFLNPSPDFWQISFPPEDWVVPESVGSDSL